MKQLTLNLQGDLEATGEMRTSSFLVASPNLVSPLATLEKDWEKKMIAIFGPKCSEPSEKSDHAMSLGRTFVESLVGRTDWFSKRCSLTWKVKDTKSKRSYFQLSVSMPRTSETEFTLLLKTPAAMDAYSENLSKKEQKFGNSGTLAQEVQTGFIYKRGVLPKEQEDTRTTGKNSQLNPRFVAEMMGFPPDWTTLPFQNGGSNQ